MKDSVEKGMWLNLAKGILLLLGGMAAVLLVETVYDRIASPPGDGLFPSMGSFAFKPDGQAYYDFAMTGDGAGIGIADGVPSAFEVECFDPMPAGQARSTCEGSVVQVLSDFDCDQLFGYCDEHLRERGWIRIDSGTGTRGSFAKGAGCYRWLFLDVGGIGHESSAVIVLKGVA